VEIWKLFVDNFVGSTLVNLLVSLVVGSLSWTSCSSILASRSSLHSLLMKLMMVCPMTCLLCKIWMQQMSWLCTNFLDSKCWVSKACSRYSSSPCRMWIS
jgi:hypothetical protein